MLAQYRVIKFISQEACVVDRQRVGPHLFIRSAIRKVGNQDGGRRRRGALSTTVGGGGAGSQVSQCRRVIDRRRENRDRL